MLARNKMAEQLDVRRPGFTLERPFYVDPDYYQLDLEAIWYRSWLFVGHACEIKKRGQWVTAQVGDYSIVVLRDGEGGVRAFHNSCRHRGSRICSAAKGSSVRLVCPYHQWSYGLDGRLMKARRMGDDLDLSLYGLKPVHCEVLCGYIFVCFADQAPDFAPVRALLQPYLARHGLERTKVAAEVSIVEEANWKLVWENNRECYHCAGNHPELCRTFPEAPTVAGVSHSIDDPHIVDLWNRCEAAGLPSRYHLSDDGAYRAVRVPLLGQAVSYTMSGEAAVRQPLGDLGFDGIGALLLFHFPTIWNHVLADQTISFQLAPLGPRQTRLTTRWLVHEDAVEGIDYDLANLTEVWNATNDQDRRITEENQKGILSPAYEPGPYAPDDENGVAQFVEWYGAVMTQFLAVEFDRLRNPAPRLVDVA